MKILCPHCKQPQHIEAPRRGDFYFYDCECGALLQFETSIGGTVFVSVEAVPGAGELTGVFEPVEEAALTVAEMRSLLEIYETLEKYEDCKRIFEMIQNVEK